MSDDAFFALAERRLLKIKRARESLQDYIELQMPDPEYPGDPDRSLFTCEPHHRMLIEAIERMVKGELDEAGRKMMRFACSIPPQHGKSLILSRMATAWMIGRKPTLHIIVGSYAAGLAKDIGSDVRDLLLTKTHAMVFPACVLRDDSQSKSELGTTKGGDLLFVGRGEGTTGKPCDFFIIDDPIKDAVEANSPIIRDQVWKWYSGVVFSRCHGKAPILIVHTRWHEDDLIGRLCDPTHPDYNEKKSKRWVYINIPAILDDEVIAELLGKKVGDALWPDRFPLEHLEEARGNDEATFTALYLGRPSPADGDYFKIETIFTYNSPDELPKNLRMYAASDHALTKNQKNDANCLGCIGVDEGDTIWVMPDIWWKRAETNTTVEAMIDQMQRHKPITWWAARDHISKSIGPFLKKRMREEKVYSTQVIDSPEVVDAEQRAQSIRGRMAMGRVKFPAFASWWLKAKDELLKFPKAKHDDFVSFMSHVGMGLSKTHKARKPSSKTDASVKTNTIAWVKASARAEQKKRNHLRLVAGM
jgi:predicted phage terminase large subunit-like protein